MIQRPPEERKNLVRLQDTARGPGLSRTIGVRRSVAKWYGTWFGFRFLGGSIPSTPTRGHVCFMVV